MKIYDISQEIFSCRVYPGDPSPRKERLSSIDNGECYNLTAFYMCAHNGTHIDAPYHFINNGNTVENIALSKTVGPTYVSEYSGDITADRAKEILRKAESQSIESAKRILIKGNATVTLEAAIVFSEKGIDLIGNESQSIGPENAPMAVHKVLLEKEVVLLEGIRLSDVREGVYFLSAAPLSLAGSDGAPCRAILIEF